MPDRAVYKSRPAEFLDRLFGGQLGDLRDVYEQVVGNLASARRDGLGETSERLVERGELPPDIGVERFERAWLSGAGPMADQDVERVLRLGYEAAIRIARNRDDPLPIETLWVKGVSDEFEVHICESERHVTVILFIPTDRPYGSQNAASKSWVVRVAWEGDYGDVLDDEDPPVVAVQTSGPRPSSGG
jgi:hypothetical protein